MGFISVAFFVVGLGIPLLFAYGKSLRRWTSGRINKTRVQKWHEQQP